MTWENRSPVFVPTSAPFDLPVPIFEKVGIGMTNSFG